MSEQPDLEYSTFNRRRVLKMTGSAAVAGVALTGTASAEHEDTITFCGCSQVCVCCLPCTSGTVIVEGGPNRDIDQFECVEVDEGEKIVAVDTVTGDSEFTDIDIVCNPNRCAQNTDFDFSQCDTFGNSGGNCGDRAIRDCPTAEEDCPGG